jgi:hypothetical protein
MRGVSRGGERQEQGARRARHIPAKVRRQDLNGGLKTPYCLPASPQGVSPCASFFVPPSRR